METINCLANVNFWLSKMERGFFHYIKIMYNVCDFKMKLTFIAHLEKKGVIANKITH